MTQSADRPDDDPNTPPPPPPPGWTPDPEPPHGDPLTGHGEQQPPQPPPPSYGQPPPAPPAYGGYEPYGSPGHEQQQYGYQQPQYNPGYPQQYGYDPGAPYGLDPKTGIPFSDKSKLVAGLLQILLPLGIGRMYMGQTGMGVAQLLVTVFTCGVGAIWPFVDGILILVGDQRDAQGRPLRS